MKRFRVALTLALVAASVGCADPGISRDASADSAIESDAATPERDAVAPMRDAQSPVEDAQPDASPPSDGGPRACEPIESAHAPAAQTCAEPAVVLGRASTASAPRAPGVETFALTVVAESDARSLAGADARETSWVDGDDATVHFRAPRGGRWRVTARGIGAHRITAQRACSPSAAPSEWQRTLELPAESWPVTGPDVVSTVAIELYAQRDERFDFVVDGCARGTRCSFEVRAERVAELACAPGNACAAGESCFIDRCDSERYACVSAERIDEIVPSRVRAWFDGRTVFVSGTTAGWPRNLPPIQRELRYELLDSSGALAPHATSSPTASIRGGFFGATQTALYPRPEVTKIRVWFAPRIGRTARASVIADIEPTRAAQPVQGERCEPSSYVYRCADGLACIGDDDGLERCVSLAGRATRVRSVTANTQSYRDPNGIAYGGPMVLLNILGESLPTGVVAAKAYDEDGNELTNDGAECVDGDWTAAPVRRFVCAVRMRVETVSRVTRVRLEAPQIIIDANVTPMPVSAFGGPCGLVGRSPYVLGEIGRCAEGLGCASNRCVLPRSTTHLCFGAAPAEWTPVGATSTLTGATRSTVYSRACGSSSALWLSFDFVATSAGRYRFASAGPVTLTVRRYCAGLSCGGAGIPIDDVELAAGERLHFQVQTTSEAPTYTITATRL